MLERFPLTSTDITEAEAYYSLEPFGGVRDDLRFGLLLSLMHAQGKGKDTPHTTWWDWCPNADMPDEAWEALQARMRAEMLRRHEARSLPAKVAKDQQAAAAIALFKAFNKRFETKGK